MIAPMKKPAILIPPGCSTTSRKCPPPSHQNTHLARGKLSKHLREQGIIPYSEAPGPPHVIKYTDLKGFLSLELPVSIT